MLSSEIGETFSSLPGGFKDIHKDINYREIFRSVMQMINMILKVNEIWKSV